MRKIISLFICMFLFSMITYSQSGWTVQTNPLTPSDIGCVQVVSQSEAWIAGTHGKLLHTTNGGDNWSIVTLETIDTLWCLKEPALNMYFENYINGWVLYSKGSENNPTGVALYITTNSGSNWIKHNIPGWSSGLQVQFISENIGWLTLLNGTFPNFTEGLLYTTDGCSTWTTLGQSEQLRLTYFADMFTGWSIPLGINGTATCDTILKTTNSGENWNQVWGTNRRVSFERIYFPDPLNGWVTGDKGIVLNTTNAGINWSYLTISSVDTNYYMQHLYFFDGLRGWIAGYKNQQNSTYFVLHTTNNGQWTWQTPPVTNKILCVDFWDLQNGFLTTSNGIICHTTTGGEPIGIKRISEEVPIKFELYQNYPNPFNPSTKIRCSLPNPSEGGAMNVSLVIYDVLGKEVETLVNEQLNPGTYEVEWDGSNYPSGVYFYSISMADYKETKRMVLLK